MKTAGGIVLYRLLKDYPADRLRVIEQNADPGRGLLACRYDSQAAPWQRFEQSRFHRLKRTMHGFGLAPDISAEKIDRLLGKFQPDVVLCVMQHAVYYCSASRYAQSRRTPLVVIVHDVNEEFEPVLSFGRDAVRRRDGTFYRQAQRRLCISAEMEELCAERYGVRGNVLYPIRGDQLRPRAFVEALNLKNPGRLTVGFVGNLNYGYGAELLRQLPAFRSTMTRLVIFSQQPGRSCAALLDAPDCVDFRGFVPSEEAWRVVKAECDAVIMPYPNPAGTMETLYRYHFPSKLPEYLALGMPVVVTGPNYATGVRWAERHQDAVVYNTAPEIDGLARIFERLRDDADYRLNLAKAGNLAGNEDFDPAHIKSEFMAYMREAAAARDAATA